MNHVIFTYPNMSYFNINKRGGLKKRLKELKRINLKYNTQSFQVIEIPASFVGKEGLMLDHNSVKKFYSRDVIKEDIKYILHTEPAVTLEEPEGISHGIIGLDFNHRIKTLFTQNNNDRWIDNQKNLTIIEF